MKPYIFHKKKLKEYEAHKPFTRFAYFFIDTNIIKNTNISIAIYRYERGQIGPTHKHDKEVEVYYILSGNGILKIDNKIVNLNEGTLVYIPPKIEHETKNTGTKELEFLSIFSPAVDFKKMKKEWICKRK